MANLHEPSEDNAYPNDVPLELEISSVGSLKSCAEKEHQRTQEDRSSSCISPVGLVQHHDIERDVTLFGKHTGWTFQGLRGGKNTEATGPQVDHVSGYGARVHPERDRENLCDLFESTQLENLPPVPGPKLSRCRVLADPLVVTLEEPLHRGDHAHIWKVSCHGHTYALKIFKPRPSTDYWDYITYPFASHTITRADLQTYMDPFLSERRAYGRLKEMNRESLAVKCHGYLIYSESFLEEKGVDLSSAAESSQFSWRNNQSSIFLDAIPEEPVGHGSKRIYALLKDLAPVEDSEIPTQSQVKQMSRDLVALHKLGIFHGSISYKCFMTGKLIDLGTSQTVPRPFLDGHFRGQDPLGSEKDLLLSDQLGFDKEVVDFWTDEAAKTKGMQRKVFSRAFCPEKRCYDRLRGGENREFIKDLRVGEGWFNPADYKWKSIEPGKRKRMSTA
ncbi:kinetochore Sim4 complex subunit FTA2-domain-containing protein [Truncatella angustata]|uniref:Kinetochore Sim4 complex subunit FTA2-domain-containing protein n=1 Tax=Truncatella angustata TaxID=152316 RepID=A0A9P8UTS9_9PEZI|nr:kinetochore Sim4 complex subunit FTA2-domain-containing protein [Truncatella angustata]KAH6658088.1 kinetochore Sim4 complex subunit FTA2-domain-containing protein [Truncatella angustata]